MSLTVKPKAMLKFLKEKGFYLDRVTGSHHQMVKENRTVPVPKHNQD